MKPWQPTALAIALAAAFPIAARAQSMADVMKEMQALKARVADLEKKLEAAEAKQPQWGMTPEQAAEFNRISVKTEALEDSRDDAGFKGLKVSGYIEPAYIWNKRQDRAGFQFLNQQADSGYHYDTSYIGAASIDFTKETESGTIWKLTLTPNRGVGAAIDGLSIVQEASVSVPLTGNDLRLIAGQIPDWSGYEYQSPTLNPFTTHNLLFDFTLPLGYTGVGLNYTKDKWWVRGMVANVNSTMSNAGEKSPSLVFRVDYSKGEFDGWGLAGLVGKTPNYNTGDRQMTFTLEADAYYVRGDWTTQGQVSYGEQRKGAITPVVGEEGEVTYRDSRWWGASALVGYAVTPRLQALARGDYIRNTTNGGGLFGFNGYYCGETDEDGNCLPGNDGRNGLGPDLNGDLDRGANRYALTFGLKYVYDQSTTFKVEYRFDGADRAVFEDVKSGGFRKTNQLFGTSVVVAF